MKHLYLAIVLLYATHSVTVAINDRGTHKNTCWMQLQVPCETVSKIQQPEGKDFNYESINSQLTSKMSLKRFHEDKSMECYPWMYYDQEERQCKCSKIPYRSVLCDAEIRRTSILDCYCMTYDSKTNQTHLGRCVYGCGHKRDTVYYTLPNSTAKLNTYSCSEYNRDSTLCGDCLSGFSPVLYSYDLKCINCTGENMTYNWIRYIAIAYVPLTIFFFFVVISNFNGTSPLLKSYITISQGMFTPIALRAFLSVLTKKKDYVEVSVRVFGCFYGIWNLDYFRTVIPPICMTNMTHLQVLALDYAIAFYPLVLIMISYILISLHGRDVGIVVWLWRPFHKLFSMFKQNWELEGSIVKAFATFFLLSYLKIISVTFDLLIYTDEFVINESSKEYVTRKALYYDGSTEYFGEEHRPYAILALFIGFFVGFCPLVFLLIYPMKWFQKCLNALKIQRQGIETFVNCYHGYYKDGTNGTRDYRWFSISYFVLQLILFVLFMISRSIYCYSVGAVAIITLMFLQLALQPYKEEFKVCSITDSLLLLDAGCAFIMAVASDEADIKSVSFSPFSYGCVAILTLLPLVYFATVVIWWLLIKKGLKDLCKRKLIQFRAKQETSVCSVVESNHFPHRLENPAHYCNSTPPNSTTPLFSGPRVPRLAEPPMGKSAHVYDYGSLTNNTTQQ